MLTSLRPASFLRHAAVTLLATALLSCAPTAKRAERKSCKALKTCEPNVFDAAYSSMDDCMEGWDERAAEQEDEYGEDCAKALHKITICLSKAYIKDCDASFVNTENSCRPEWTQADEVCPPEWFEDYK